MTLPLPANAAWLVTTEVGGWDCNGIYDQYHDVSNYFSIDFSWRNDDGTGKAVYSSTDRIPVYAAADGTVVAAPETEDLSNGFYVVIDHDQDGDASTGFSTRYLHLDEAPSVKVGQMVSRRELIGYMGSTGLSKGKHLHFGVRYENNGSYDSAVQHILLSSWPLKQFQTECNNSIPIRYYWP